jgi:hypothetical protein
MKNNRATLITLVIFLVLPASCGDSGSGLPFGTYTVKAVTAGADSLDNLALVDNCIKRNDEQCFEAMVMDGRAFPVEAGTSIDGTEIGYGVFEGRVYSGRLVGKEIYIPVVALK